MNERIKIAKIFLRWSINKENGWQVVRDCPPKDLTVVNLSILTYLLIWLLIIYQRNFDLHISFHQ